jgi:hypothetical protein
MGAPELTEIASHGVTLLADPNRPCGVTLAFTQRTGGVSKPPFASLNIGALCGDDPAAVAENRRRVLASVGAEAFAGNLIAPKQVHGVDIVTVASNDPAAVSAAQECAALGADAVVCTATDVPVLLCYADCAPVILASPGGFSVIHSGWRGTIAHIAGLALVELLAATGDSVEDVYAYIGPHILGRDYEVSGDLMARFIDEFGSIVSSGENRLSLDACIRQTLYSQGVQPWQVADADVSTPQATDRYFSYRKEKGECGRHGAVAWRPSRP